MAIAKGIFPVLLLCCVVSSARAATCFFNTATTISTADITNLAAAAGSNNFNPPLDSPLGFRALTTHSVNLGTAQFCIVNDFLFESTHIQLSDIQLAANDVVSQCCSSSPDCQGGQFTITGDNGIKVVLTVQALGASCDP